MYKAYVIARREYLAMVGSKAFLFSLAIMPVFMLGGAVITEVVFAWPGIGRYLVQAIFTRDYPVVQGAILVIAISYVIINFFTDMVYSLLDPRIRVH